MVLKMIRRSQLITEIRKRRRQIPYDYADYIEKNSVSEIANERQLPYPKDEIWEAIMFCIANSKTKQEAQIYINLLSTLSSFQDIGERDDLSYSPLKDPETATSEDISKHARAMKPYLALRQQYWPLVERDQALFLESVKEAMSANEYLWPSYKRFWAKFISLGSNRKIPAECIDFPR